VLTKEPAQYTGDEAAREVPGRPEPVPPVAQGRVNLRILVLALATFAIGTGTYIVAGLLGGATAARMAPPERKGRALSVTIGGSRWRGSWGCLWGP
jgi:hypothetical protein